VVIDVNCWCDTPQGGQSLADLERTAEECARWRVRECWVGSFDALFDLDPVAVCVRTIARRCNVFPGRIRLFGTVNPTLGGIRDQLEELHRAGFQGIRLYPPAHGYDLADPRFRRLQAFAEKMELVLQLVCRIEDPRTQHPPGKWPELDLASLANIRLARPLVLLNCPLTRLPDPVRANRLVFVDTAWLEGLGPLDRAVEALGTYERLLFGSYWPVFPLASAALKLRETTLAPEAVRCVAAENARRLVPP